MLHAINLLVLIGAANVAPLIATRLLGERWSWPLDGGLRFLDNAPLFGRSKTVRGVVVGVLVPALLAPVLGHPAAQGAAIGVAAIVGDLVSSFCKRRLKLAPSSQAPGLDQIPEVLLPLLLARGWFGVSWAAVAVVLVAFVVLQVTFSKLFYRWKLRDKPY